jgi:hypothetical protein
MNYYLVCCLVNSIFYIFHTSACVENYVVCVVQHFRNIAATALRNALPPPAAQPSFDGGQGQADQLTL